MFHPTTFFSSAALPRTASRGPRTSRPSSRMMFAAGVVAAAIVDADGKLLSADPSIAALNERAGGAIGSTLQIGSTP